MAQIRKNLCNSATSEWRCVPPAIILPLWLFAAALAIPGAETDFSAQSFAAYSAARSNYLAQATNTTSAWRFAKSVSDWADHATNDEQRASLAEEGIAACREALARDPDSAGAHYYLALNLGELAQTKSLGALKLVREMEREWKRSLELDPNFECGGPDRSLGMLYRDAPGWPLSIGSKGKAREHLEHAVKICPENPDNLLTLIESYLKWHDRKEALEAITRYPKILPEAHKRFSGPEWAEAWADWDARWQEILRQTGSSPGK